MFQLTGCFDFLQWIGGYGCFKCLGGRYSMLLCDHIEVLCCYVII